MESFWQALLDISANHISRYGLYIPGEQYVLILWNELLVIILSFVVTILVMKNKGLKRIIARDRSRRSNQSPATLQDMAPGREAVSHRQVAPRREVALTRQKETLDDSQLMLVSYAINFKDTLMMKYMDYGGEISERVILPLRVYRDNGRQYISAFCYLRHEERTFRADRILDLQLTQKRIKQKKAGRDRGGVELVQ